MLTKNKVNYSSDDDLALINNRLVPEELEKDCDQYLRTVTYSKGHARSRDKLQDDLISIIKEDKEVLRSMTELVKDRNCSSRMVPKAFVLLGGEKNLNKINTVSPLL